MSDLCLRVVAFSEDLRDDIDFATTLFFLLRVLAKVNEFDLNWRKVTLALSDLNSNNKLEQMR